MPDTSFKQQQFPPLLTKKQAARDIYKVTERTIDRWLCAGTIPTSAKLTIGRSVRFRTDVLLEHIANSNTRAVDGGCDA